MINGSGARLVARLALALWVLVLTWTSLAPADRLPGMGGISDKMLHVIAYLVLGAIGVFALPSLRPLALLGCIVGFGLLMEVLQYFTGYRAFEWADLVADLVGAAIGMTGALVLRDVLRRRWA